MNARQAIEENNLKIRQLVDSSKEMATRLSKPVTEVINFKVDSSISFAKNETEKAALEARRKSALLIANNK